MDTSYPESVLESSYTPGHQAVENDTGRILRPTKGELYPQATVREKDRYGLHALLFFVTLASTIYSGGQMAGRYLIYLDESTWLNFFGMQVSADFLLDGLRFGGSLLLFLTVHEFGHYVAARLHRVDTSLPYFIPFPWNGIGTFGAVIRIREQIPSMRKLFDIGAAGPLAGFVIALGVLLVGLFTLPSLDYVAAFPGHEALKAYVANHGAFPDQFEQLSAPSDGLLLVVGSTPLYWFLTQFFTDVPPLWEMYHYPVLFAGWLGLFFTAVNLLPVGQLDGGHILYALVGPKWHRRLARGFVLILLLSGGIGFVDEIGPLLNEWVSAAGILPWLALSFVLLFYLHRIFGDDYRLVIASLFGVISLIAVLRWSPTVVSEFGYSGWLVWCLLIVVMIRVDHPPVGVMEPLTKKRRVLAILGLVIFALCFSIKPLYIV